MADELVQLMEDLEILEGVSDAINFGMSPSEFDVDAELVRASRNYEQP